MKYTLAFDVYGTLINTSGIFDTLVEMIGNRDKAKLVTGTWRNKQLEYSFRRGLMGNYVDFSVCTKDALQFCIEAHQLDLGENQIDKILEKYTVLPPFDDAMTGIKQLQATGHRLYAFSNGSHASVKKLLVNAGIEGLFDGIVTMEGAKTFKPNPAGHQYFNEQTASKKRESWLISSNPFDVIGATSYGMNSAWVQRSVENVFDPWGIEPTLVVSDLVELSTHLKQGK